jgi:hypothetical protein
MLGTPTQAAIFILDTLLAPPKSGRTATLLQADYDTTLQVYQLEYTLQRSAANTPLLRVISVVALTSQDVVLTLSVVAPESEWKDATYKSRLGRIADSFHMV